MFVDYDRNRDMVLHSMYKYAILYMYSLFHTNMYYITYISGTKYLKHANIRLVRAMQFLTVSSYSSCSSLQRDQIMFYVTLSTLTINKSMYQINKVAIRRYSSTHLVVTSEYKVL